MVSASTNPSNKATTNKKNARLYVGRLNATISQLSLKAFFSKFGDILQVEKPGDKFGFVQFKKVEDAQTCLSELGNNATINDVNVVVQPSQSSSTMQQRRGGPPVMGPSNTGSGPSTRTGGGQKSSAGWRSGNFDASLLTRAPGGGVPSPAAKRFGPDSWTDSPSSLRSSFGPMSSGGISRFSSLLGSSGDLGYDRMKGPDSFGESRGPSYGSLSLSRYSEPSPRDSFGPSSLRGDFPLSSSRSSFGPPSGVVQDLQELKSSIQMLMKENAKLRSEKEDIQLESELRKREDENVLLEKLHQLQQKNDEYHRRLTEFEEAHQGLRETLQMANDNFGRSSNPDQFSSFSPELQERLMMFDTLRQETVQPTEQPNWEALKAVVTNSLDQDPLSVSDAFGVHTRLGSGGPGGAQQRASAAATAAGMQQRLGGRVKLPGGTGRQMGNQSRGLLN